jgi:hypothetical protein
MKPIYLVYEDNGNYNVRRMDGNGDIRPHKNYHQKGYSAFCKDAVQKGYYVLDLVEKPPHHVDAVLLAYIYPHVSDDTQKQLKAIAKKL